MRAIGLSNDLRKMYDDIALGIPREMSKHIVGANPLIDALLVTLLAGSGNRGEGVEESLGHLLVESDVGEGKTYISKTFARTIGGKFSRIQFMRGLKHQHLRQSVRELPDRTLEFSEGPLSANIVLADEINRATDLTHAAMIDALAEGIIEVGGKEIKTPRPYMVIGTGNPRDLQGIVKLGTAMNDRLVFKVSSPEYTEDEEIQIVTGQEERAKQALEVVCSPEDILNLCDHIHEDIELNVQIARMIIGIARRARDATDSDDIRVHGASGHRPSIWLYRVAKVVAFLNQRMYVIPDDALKYAYKILNHRIDMGFGSTKDELRQLIDDILREEKRYAAGFSS